jgi:cytidyltransferase-like protein
VRVGLYGGTFDPIHNGHVHVIKELITQKIVDQHIIEYTDRYEYQYPVNDKDDSLGEALSILKSIKRHLLIKKII